MLKKICVKKLILCTLVLFSIFLISLTNKKDENNIKEELNYVNSNIELSDIFLIDSNNLLANTKIRTTKQDIEQLACELLESLIIDGKYQDNIPNGFKAVLPSDVKINSLTYNNNLIKVDFNDSLLNGNEEQIIESIVYTLTSIKDVEYVMIFINNNLLTKLPNSNITLPSTLDRNFGINKEYNINSLKDITQTTIYYVSTYNNNEYYVPVTKINNDKRNKIEIIIDELSSNNVYKTNLMSYLNSNTEIISVSENNNELTLNFNDSIFNDINSKEILEEVIYTISMSINDNYDVDSVIFNVEDQQIYKSVLKSMSITCENVSKNFKH